MTTTTQTFTMPAQNVSKTFTTTVNTYKVSWTTSNCSVTEIIQVRDGDTSETISLSSGSSVKHGSKLIFKLKANSGYTMNGGTSQTFIVNGASLNLQFTASINYYSLTVNKGTGVASTSVTKVSGSQDNSGKWSYGSKVNITASPSTGYQITSGTGETTITSDKIVNVTASKLTYQVSYTTSNCSVTLHYNNASGSQISSGSYVEYGTVVYVKASPNTGYTLDGSYNGTTFTVTGKTTKTYTATKIKYRVAWTTSNCSVTLKTSGGTTISNGSSYDYGTVINVTATANTGYTMNSYSSQFTLTSDSYKTLKYTASANKRQFKINVGTGVSTVYYKVAGGSQYSTTTTKTIDVYYGQSVEVYGVAKTGYNAPNYHSGNKYILNSMPNSNQSVTISATIAYYTVNFQCVSHPNGGNTTYCSWNKSSISVPYGTTYYRSGDKIIFSNGTQVIFNYPADSSGVDFSVTYNGVSTSSQSITASKTITAVVRTIYY